MADPSTYRPAPGTIPDAPGVYRFRDATGRVIYVGKAKSLRSRLNSYFADTWGLHPRTQQMVTTATRVDWVTVGTEVEALQLEYTWIKEYDPRFNVRYRDDKSYPYLAVTLDEEYPRLQVMRGAKRKGVRYFGPYSHAWAIRETLDLLLRVFPARTCSAGVFKRAGQIGRPCLLGYIGKCSAPVRRPGRARTSTGRSSTSSATSWPAAPTPWCAGWSGRCERAATELEFERAARLRDDIAALRRAMEKQTVVLGDGTDADVVAFAEDPLEAAVQVFHVRGGRVRGQRGWVVEKTEDLTTGELVHHFCSQVYGERARGEHGRTYRASCWCRRCRRTPTRSPNGCREHRGSRVTLRVPQRGDKKALLETVARNAGQALTQHKLRRAGDLTTRSKALEEIAEALGLDCAPLRIECYDVSQIQGTDVVASMVVFEDGLARKSEYRRFAVTAAAHRRRVRDVRGAAPPVRPLPRGPRRDRRARRRDGRSTRTGPAIDPTTGRAAQVRVPAAVGGGRRRRSRRSTRRPRCWPTSASTTSRSAAWPSGWRRCGCRDDEFPVILPRTSEGLYLLQRVRDEAHRFAITFHRQRRSKRMTTSGLDGVPGLGEVRRKALLRRFGSLKRLAAATVEEIAEVPGIGRRTAEAMLAALAGDPR